MDWVDASAQNNIAIITAAADGHLDVVKFLVTVNGVNVKAENNLPIYLASRYRHMDDVKFLRPHCPDYAG